MFYNIMKELAYIIVISNTAVLFYKIYRKEHFDRIYKICLVIMYMAYTLSFILEYV
ncbi:MAG: hypothetical protein ACM3O3_12320 [Syntrophothermus sp.]